MDQNKRKQPRKSTNVTTRVSFKSSRTGDIESTIGETKDLSRGGVQLQIPRISEIEEIKEIMLRLPGHTDPIKTDGEIQWTSEQDASGFAGIRFTSLSSSQQQLIEDFLGVRTSNEIIKKATLLRFQEMKAHLKQMLELDESERELLNKVSPLDVYYSAEIINVDTGQVAELIAEHLEVEYVPELQPINVKANRLSPQFCKHYQLVPVDAGEDQQDLVLSNPFQHLFFSIFQNYYGGSFQNFSITEPDVINNVLEKKYENTDLIPGYSPTLTGPFTFNVGTVANPDPIPFSHYCITEEFDELDERAKENQPDTVDYILKNLLASTIEEDDVDQIFLNPEEDILYVRSEEEADPECDLEMSNDLFNALIIRIKILAGMDLTDQWRSRAGEFNISYFDHEYTVHAEVNPDPDKGSASLQMSEN